MSHSPASYRYVAGDELPHLAWELEDTDLDDYDTIVLNVRFADGSLETVEATIDDADAGTFHFEFTTDFWVEGTHYGDIVLTTTDGEDETLPPEGALEFIVRARV